MSGEVVIGYVALPHVRCALKYMICFNFSSDQGRSFTIEPIQL